MSDRSLILVLSNDSSPAAVKTSRHLCLALARLGLGAIVRDTRLIRWAAAVERESPVRREVYENAVVAKWNTFVSDYGLDTIISLDLHWLFSSRLFVDDERVHRIHSFWLNDVRSHLPSDSRFSLAPHTLLELINKPKIRHHCCCPGQAEELRLLGVERVSPSSMETPAEILPAGETEEQLWEHRLGTALA
jgi:hypothetical protein